LFTYLFSVCYLLCHFSWANKSLNINESSYTGELCDAYLNRDIDHETRIIMVMRSYFFLEIWEEYIKKAASFHSHVWFSIQHSFVSLQSNHIFKSLAESLVLLVIAHRDFYSKFPLLPWEHGTEALEHIFGIARRLVPDFTFYELYKVVHRVMYYDKLQRDGNFHFSQEKTVASGNHMIH